VIPTRTNHILMKADEPDVYSGQCKEFCGDSHSRMRIRVVAQTPEEFDAWIQDQLQEAAAPSAGGAAEGAEIFSQTCTACHAVAGTEGAPDDDAALSGPNLTHLMSRERFGGNTFENTEDNLRRWIADPPAMKPGTTMPDYGLSDEQIDAVVTYLQTLE
jgi:cytochrome c oxidase subunit 2